MRLPRDIAYSTLGLSKPSPAKPAFTKLYTSETAGTKERLEVELFGQAIDRGAALKIVNALSSFMADDATSFSMWNSEEGYRKRCASQS